MTLFDQSSDSALKNTGFVKCYKGYNEDTVDQNLGRMVRNKSQRLQRGLRLDDKAREDLDR